MEKFTTCSKVQLDGSFLRFSLIRSKTTIESWIENPITVKTAVMNRASISTSKNLPNMENIPTNKKASCNIAMIALAPNLRLEYGLGIFLKA